MRNKQVEFNPYIYTLTILSKLYRFGYEISVFNTKHPVIILRASLFVVTPSHVASSKIECQNFSYVYRSRKHWECKYNLMNPEERTSFPYIYNASNKDPFYNSQRKIMNSNLHEHHLVLLCYRWRNENLQSELNRVVLI